MPWSIRRLLTPLLSAALLLAVTANSFAQRPSGPELLPHSTLAMIRIADVPQLAERFQQIALGKVFQDPQMQPLVSRLYGAAQDAFGKNAERLGLPLDQLLSVPQGEICVAFVAPADQDAGVVILIDSKDKVDRARKLIPTLQEAVRRIAERLGSQSTRLGVEERDGTLIGTTTKELMDTVLANFGGAPLEKTLADNDKYNAVINRCLAGGDQPQISWYTDPIALTRCLASDSFAATFLALFPALGLDGLEAVGGTITLAAGDFDTVQHVHMLLDNPRLGLVDAIGLRSGDMTPETWVPGECVSYLTIHWDLRHTFRACSQLFNGIMGDGAFENRVRGGFDWLGVDFEKEIMPQLTGRASVTQWIERPVRLNSATTIGGIQLGDPKAFKPILDKIVQKYSGNLERHRYGDVTYWSIKGENLGFFPWQWQDIRQQNEMKKRGVVLRERLSCFGIVNDCLVLTDSLKAFQEAIAAQTNLDNSLSTSLEYKLIASKIRSQPGGNAPGMMQFQRPEEGFRLLYDLATADETKNRLQRAEKNSLFGSVNQALKDHPLPPFSVLAEYMAPGGGMITNDESGIHYTTFTLKRK